MAEISYRDYKTITYTRGMGSGTTLGMVIQAVTESQSDNPPQVVSNMTLNGITYEPFQTELAGTYKGKLILIDMAWTIWQSRVRKRPIGEDETNHLFSNNRVSLTTSHIELLPPSRREKVRDGAVFLCKHCIMDNGEARLYITVKAPLREPAPFIIKNVDKFYKYYDTSEML